jgi:hypothetical protein
MSNISTFDDVFANSLFVVNEEHPETDALTDCADWINSKTEEKKLAPLYVEQCNSTDVSDNSDSTVPSSCGVRYIDKIFQD